MCSFLNKLQSDNFRRRSGSLRKLFGRHRNPKMKRLLWLKNSNRSQDFGREDDLTRAGSRAEKDRNMDGIVRLERQALGGFGFSVIGGVDTHLPPMICAIVQNGSAHLSGKVNTGDVILEVNNRSIKDLTTQEVVDCIKDSPDEIALRLMQDSGAKERAKPYLRPFTVADPKIPLYQAKLHRTASVPLKPHKSRNTENKVNSQQRSTDIVRRKTATSKDELRRQRALEMEQNTDRTYLPKRETSNESFRVMTYFPVDGKTPKTIENYSSHRSERSERRSFPEQDSEDSSTTLSANASANSLPKSCPYCGGGMLVSSTPGLHGSSAKHGPTPTALRCRKCGKNMKVTVSNTSLPEKSRTVQKNHQSTHLKPANSLPPNVTLSTHTNDSMLLHTHFDKDVHLKSSSSGTLTGSDLQLDKDKAREFAIKLYQLNGYTKDEVAPELSKNTSFSKMVAKEYLKLFDFADMSIVTALRKFIKHVLLIGETQERERILIPFSERYYECNKPDYCSSDAIHTLVCAVLLLNTDLHAEKISKKMTIGEFNDNMAGLCDEGDFPKELLKSIYQEIKQTPFEWSGEKPPISAPATPKPSRSTNGIRAMPGNPFLEIQCDENDKVYREGLLYRKVTMESEGKKTSAWKRKWLPFYATLKGIILFLRKSDETSALENNRNCLGVHHSFASRATDYRKKQFVFRLVTADWREFLFQAKDQPDMKEWIDTINLVAATFSSPPLAAPVGSSKRFQRPVLPFSKTRLTLDKQIEHHEKKAKESQDDLIACLQSEPRDGSTRDHQEWQEKRDFLEYEYKRYKSYVTSLRGSKLESKLRDKTKNEARSADSIMLQLKRSSSIGNIDSTQGYRPRNLRDSYFMAIYQGQ